MGVNYLFPFIIDFIILFIISMFIYSGFRSGMIKSIMLFFNTIISWFFSAGFTELVSRFIYLKVIQPYINREVNMVISNNNITTSVLSEKMPSVLLDCLSYFGITLSKFNHIINSVSKDVLPGSLNQIFMPMFMKVLKPLVAGILFSIIAFLGSLIVKLIMRIFKLRVLSTGNKLIGGLIGALKGYVVILVVACILKVLLPFIEVSSNNNIISEVIPSTIVFKHMYNNNPLCTILESM